MAKLNERSWLGAAAGCLSWSVVIHGCRNGGSSMQTVRPRAIRLEASSFCQLRCPSCPTTARAIHPAVGSGFLRLDDFRRLIDENPSLATIELSNYGEIFLNPQLLQIFELAHERNIALTAGNGVNL